MTLDRDPSVTGVSNVRYGDVECLLLVSANASNGQIPLKNSVVLRRIRAGY